MAGRIKLPSTFLNVDYYRNLLVDDPKMFWKVVEEKDFITAIHTEIQGLLNEMTDRMQAAERKDWPQLIAKLGISVGMTQQMANKLVPKGERSNQLGMDPASAKYLLRTIRQAEKAELKALNQNNPTQNGERRQLLRLPDFPKKIFPWNSDKLDLVADVCLMMKLHKRLIAAIAEDPFLNAGLNFTHPDQIQTNLAPVLGLQGSTKVDNNSNE